MKGDACRFIGFRHSQKMPKIAAYAAALFGNDTTHDELAGNCAPASTAGGAAIAKELSMRNRLLAIAAIAAAIGVPVAGQAQDAVTTGVARGGPVVGNEGFAGIADGERPAFREYIIREHVPNYTIPDRVVVGGVLPEAGVTYYDVPQTFGITPYRYTVVNGRTVLVEPRTRRIVQVVE